MGTKLYESVGDEVSRVLKSLEDDKKSIASQIKELEVRKRGLAEEVRIEEVATERLVAAEKSKREQQMKELSDLAAPLTKQIETLKAAVRDEMAGRERTATEQGERIAALNVELSVLSQEVKQRRLELNSIYEAIGDLKKKVSSL